MPYRTSSPESLEHAQLVIDKLGIPSLTIDISDAVDGYLKQVGDADPHRLGNVMARERMIVQFDLSAKHKALPWVPATIGAAARLFHLARRRCAARQSAGRPVQDAGLGARAARRGTGRDRRQAGDRRPDQRPDRRRRPRRFIRAPDRILYYLIRGETPQGFIKEEVEIVRHRLDSTHWKRRLPTVAVLSQTAIGEFYLRPVDY